MLDAFIIDQLRRDREERRWEPTVLELPLPSRPANEPDDEDDEEDDEKPIGGVVIIEPDGKVTRL